MSTPNYQRIKINWSKEIPVRKIKKYKDRRNDYLYMIVRRRRYWLIPARKVKYIGMTYKQSLSERLKDHHKLPKVLNRLIRFGRITVRFGQIIPDSGKRVTEKLVRDVESALIYHEQPDCNEVSKKGYHGRPLVIYNRGRRKPLPKCFKIS